MWVSNPSLLKEKFGVVNSLLIVGCLDGSKVDGETVSQPLLPILMWIFFLFTCCVGVVQLVLRFFFRGNCSVCSCRFGVSIGGGEFRILLCCHLELEP